MLSRSNFEFLFLLGHWQKWTLSPHLLIQKAFKHLLNWYTFNHFFPNFPYSSSNLQLIDSSQFNCRRTPPWEIVLICTVDYLYITDSLSKRYGTDRQITVYRSIAFKTIYFVLGNNNHSYYWNIKRSVWR